MTSKNPVNKGSKGKPEVILASELAALNTAAVGQYTGKQKYVDMLFSVIKTSPATVTAHARYLEGLPEKDGGGRSGALIKLLRANLQAMAKSHKLAAIPTVKALSKDGPLELTTRKEGAKRKTGGKTEADKNDKASRPVTLQDCYFALSTLCRTMTPAQKAHVIVMATDAITGNGPDGEPLSDDDTDEK